jgi:hypothetical protein
MTCNRGFNASREIFFWQKKLKIKLMVKTGKLFFAGIFQNRELILKIIHLGRVVFGDTNSPMERSPNPDESTILTLFE